MRVNVVVAGMPDYQLCDINDGRGPYTGLGLTLPITVSLLVDAGNTVRRC